MPSNRIVTSLAIVFGGVLGSVAALVGPKPGATSAPSSLPFAPVSRGSDSLEVTVRAETPIPPPPELAAEARPAVAESEPEPIATEPVRDVKQAELACARGDGRACLDAAELYASAEGGGDPERARMLTGLGVQRFAIRCMDRIPSGCLELAKLHNAGRGVARDQKAADALVDRATVLCRARPDADGCPGAER